VVSASGAAGSLFEAQLAELKLSAAALAATGSLMAGMQSSHGCTGPGSTGTPSALYIRPICLSPALQAQALAAIQPLLAQVQCVGLKVDTYSSYCWGQSPITTLGELGPALSQNITQLCLWLSTVVAPDMCGHSKWESLLDALPHVKVVQLRFLCYGEETADQAWVAGLLEDAMHAVERRGR
jgi:hypothetical protein